MALGFLNFSAWLGLRKAAPASAAPVWTWMEATRPGQTKAAHAVSEPELSPADQDSALFAARRLTAGDFASVRRCLERAVREKRTHDVRDILKQVATLLRVEAQALGLSDAMTPPPLPAPMLTNVVGMDDVALRRAAKSQSKGWRTPRFWVEDVRIAANG